MVREVNAVETRPLKWGENVLYHLVKGIVVTEEIADIFRSAIELYYLVGKKVPLNEH